MIGFQFDPRWKPSQVSEQNNKTKNSILSERMKQTKGVKSEASRPMKQNNKSLSSSYPCKFPLCSLYFIYFLACAKINPFVFSWSLYWALCEFSHCIEFSSPLIFNLNSNSSHPSQKIVNSCFRRKKVQKTSWANCNCRWVKTEWTHTIDDILYSLFPLVLSDKNIYFSFCCTIFSTHSADLTEDKTLLNF